MSEELKPQLPAEIQKSSFSLNVSMSEVAEEKIKELSEKYKDLPAEVNSENIENFTVARAEIRSVRISAGKYKDALKKEIKGDAKTLIDKVENVWEDMKGKLLAIENPISEKIKASEERIKLERERKKREKEEREAKIADEIQRIKDIPLDLVKAKPAEIKAKIEELKALELSVDVFADRIDEAEFAKELTTETLSDLFTEAFKREKDAEELARKKKEAAEEKRVDKLKAKIKDLEQHVLDAVMADSFDKLEDVFTQVSEMAIHEAEYDDFFEQAKDKHAEVLKKISEIYEAKKKAILEEEQVKAQKELDKIVDFEIDMLKNMTVELVGATSARIKFKQVFLFEKHKISAGVFLERTFEVVNQKQLTIKTLQNMFDKADAQEEADAQLKVAQDKIEADQKKLAEEKESADAKIKEAKEKLEEDQRKLDEEKEAAAQKILDDEAAAQKKLDDEAAAVAEEETPSEPEEVEEFPDHVKVDAFAEWLYDNPKHLPENIHQLAVDVCNIATKVVK